MSSNSLPGPAGNDVFVGDGEMATLMRSHDWASTSLGPPAGWPNALKVAVRLLLTSRFDMWLGWGPDIAFLYNDAYRPTLGIKHPRSLGMPTQALWSEIWHDIEPRLKRVFERGEATWDRALLLLLERSGYPEETYHTFSYSPLIGDSGKVEGVFCAVTEDTDRVISERRLSSLRDLASGLSMAEGRAAVLAAARVKLDGNRHDLPFCIAYLFDDDGQARLAFVNGLQEGSRLAPWLVPAEGSVWDFNDIQCGHDIAMVDLSAQPDLPTGAWNRPPVSAAVLPLAGQGGGRPIGALVIGLNPYRPIERDYIGFLKLLVGQLASSLASADIFEAERRRVAELATEVQLRTEERDRMRNLFQQSPSFMCLLQGPQHVVALVNDAYLQLVGHRELVGIPIRQALPEVEGQGFFELLDEVYATGKPFLGRNMAAQLQRSPGAPLEQRFLHLIYQPIMDSDGSVAGIFVDGYDTTHQRNAEEALHRINETLEQRVAQRTTELGRALEDLKRESTERENAQAALRQAQKMESLGALTGGVAHDFNNLLQVISGNLQLLSRHVAGNENAEKRVNNALAGVQRGARLASQLLAFGRRQPLEPKVVNIGRFIKNIDDMLRRALGEEIELETVVSGGLWNTLVDPGQIENAVLNLAINARDAMGGQGRLTIEAGNAKLDDDYSRQHDDVQAGQYVMLAVTDTGSGIPEDILDKVFEPFFSTKPEGKGTGLGLSMVYGFVKQSGGHVKIYSEIGEGTTVKIYLPRVNQVEDVLPDLDGMEVHGGSENVLVVEDDEDVRNTAVAILGDLGYRVLKARDATSALSVIDSGVPIDLLFTDVVMPGPLRSPELARKARERLPNLAVLFTSGYTENAIVHGGRLDAGVELLSKPYTREALARKIRHVLGNQGQRRAAEGFAQGAQPPAESSPAPATASEATLSLLMVEDDELIRSTTSELLEVEGYEVQQASDAATALELLAQKPVDVLLTDVGLPGVSGAVLAKQARERWPQLGVVFATGNYLSPAEAGVPGAVVLVKPYSPDELMQALAKAAAQVAIKVARKA